MGTIGVQIVKRTTYEWDEIIMILITASLTLLTLWCLNMVYMVYVIFQVVRHSVDTNDLDETQLIINFMNNADSRTVEIVLNIITINPVVFQGALLCIMAGIII